MTKHTGKKKEQPKNIVICVSGMTASGKSTVARRIAEKYHLRFYSGGDTLKAIAIEAGYKPQTNGWWESEEGLKFLQQRLHEPDFDKKVDTKLLEYAKHGNIVLDSWTMPWLFDGGFKIWIDASKKIRVKRLAKRDGISLKRALKVLEEKEETTKTIYKRLYGFCLGEDLSPFDLILDTDELDADEVFHTVVVVVDRLLPMKTRT